MEKVKVLLKKVFTFNNFITLNLILLIILNLGFKLFYSTAIVNGPSMLPTLQEDDLLVLKRAKAPSRGDIVGIKTKKHNNLVKRVIGVSGDKILINQSGLYVNGELQKETYINDQEWITLKDETEFIVPKNSYFCLGDNRIVSLDSRELGSFDESDILGVVIFDFSAIIRMSYTDIICVLWILIFGSLIFLLFWFARKKQKEEERKNVA